MEGKRVLLVDGDMRRPSLHRIFRLSQERGLTTLVSGASTLEDTIVPTEIEHVFCLPAGPNPPNPPEVLNSQPSRDLFEQLAEMYDTVIVDCPPSTGLSDIQVISTIVDGVLLVVSMNQTLKPHLEITMRSLYQSGAPLIGMVLNRADINLKGCGYYDYCGNGSERHGKSKPLRERDVVKS